VTDPDRDARIRALLVQALAEFPVPVPVITSAIISDPLALDLALAAAAPGATLLLAPTLRYPRHLTLRQPVALLSTIAGVGRIGLTELLGPTFLQGITIAGDGVTLRGLEVRHSDRTQTLVDVTGAGAVVDRCRILGDPATGQKRGIAANGAAGIYTRNYVEDCFGPYPGDDCQAFYVQSTPGPLLIEDNFLSGGTETLMIGGGDPADAAHLPSDIVIRRNTLTKNPKWQALPISVKNVLELKNARRVTIEDNDISYSWGGRGQDGYLLMLTVRNQGGTAPYSTVQDVLVGGNRFSHGAAAINVLGRDNNQPSEPMARVQILENQFADLNPVLYTGSKKMNQIDGGPGDVTIRGNVFDGVGMTSVVYFAGGPKCERLAIDGNAWPKTKYGVFGSGATLGQAWAQYVASGTLGPNTERP